MTALNARRLANIIDCLDNGEYPGDFVHEIESYETYWGDDNVDASEVSKGVSE